MNTAETIKTQVSGPPMCSVTCGPEYGGWIDAVLVVNGTPYAANMVLQAMERCGGRYSADTTVHKAWMRSTAFDRIFAGAGEDA